MMLRGMKATMGGSPFNSRRLADIAKRWLPAFRNFPHQTPENYFQKIQIVELIGQMNPS